MKIKKLLILAILFTTVKINAQTDFRTGYIINKNGDTISGEIDYRGDILMSKVCRFKPYYTDSITSYSPYDIKEFRFEKSKCYVSRNLESGERVFLEYLIKGKLNVYYFRDVENGYYLIDKEELPLKVIPPYKEKIKLREDGTRVLYQSKNHIGLLKLYTQDAPEIQNRIETIKSFDHQNLIQLAKNYHEIICKDEKCIIFEKKLPFIKPSIEFIYGKTVFFNSKYSDSIRINEYGLFLYLWMPRASEKLFFKTGFLYYQINYKDNNSIIYKIPIHIYYHYSYFNFVPSFFIGLNNYFYKSEYLWTMTSGVGLNYRFTERFLLTSNFAVELTPFSYALSDIFMKPKSKYEIFKSYSFYFGIRIDI